MNSAIAMVPDFVELEFIVSKLALFIRKNMYGLDMKQKKLSAFLANTKNELRRVPRNSILIEISNRSPIINSITNLRQIQQ